MTIETRIRAAIDRVREQSSSIPDIDRLFVSLKSEFSEVGIIDDPEGERACIALMLLTLKMLMPECKAIMETFAKKRNSKTANAAATKESRVISLQRTVDGTWKHRLPGEQQRRAAELIVLYKKSVAPTKDEDQILVRTGLATRSDFIEALACESDSSRIADLKLWLERLEPHWRNRPKMTFVEARALWETDQRQSPQADETSPQKPSVERGEVQVSVL
jgi:hypothetical protein